MPTITSVSHSINPYALFVTEAGDMYLSDDSSPTQVQLWRENASNFVSTLYVGGECFSIFIGTNESFYCAIMNSHRVIRRSLDSNDTQVKTVAGNGCPGYLPHMLSTPRGIFVTMNHDLYVADTFNHRIQLFRQNQVNGTTVAGSGAPETIQIRNPVAVVLDADEYIFIVDYSFDRIIGSGPDGFRCVVGCTQTWGPAPHQLTDPQSMAFDSYGNIFVVDSGSNRIQKFSLSSNSCSK